MLGFSFKAILIKLAYAWAPIDAVTLLALRMIYSAPFFALMAWWASSDRAAASVTRRDWLAILWLGFIGYYLASLVDFMGLQYVTASLERLMLYLYPTMVVLLSAVFFKQRITGRIVLALALSYAGIVLVFARDLSIAGDPHALWLGGALVFAGAFALRALPRRRGTGDRAAREPALHRLGDARLDGVRAAAIRAHAAALGACGAARLSSCLSLTMAMFSTVLPTFLVAEAIRRIGANRTSLVGSLGPVFTIWLGWWLLGEPVHWIQLGGAALVLAGVTLVTLRPRRRHA